MDEHKRRYVDDPQLELERYGKEIMESPKYRRLMFFSQHASSTTYRHCISVTLKALTFAKEMNIKVDVPALVHACLLHDYYLYDFHVNPRPMHATMHPIYAAINASRDFHLNDKELIDISTHMWPISLTRIPLSREGWILTYADKCVAINEYLLRPQAVERKEKKKAKAL